MLRINNITIELQLDFAEIHYEINIKSFFFQKKSSIRWYRAFVRLKKN
jgi:hypothetical protein